MGKTELARAAAEALGRPLVRLQCYEGLDEAKALYEWDYAKQMLYTQLLRDARGREDARARPRSWRPPSGSPTRDDAFFCERFLIARPLLAALRSDGARRAAHRRGGPRRSRVRGHPARDPRRGAGHHPRAGHRPRDAPAAGHPHDQRDARDDRRAPPPVPARVPRLPCPRRASSPSSRRRCRASRSALAEQLVEFAEKLRAMDLRKAPCIAETIDWARALLTLGASALDKDLATRPSACS